MHKKSGSTVPSRPKNQNIIKLKEKFGNITNYNTVSETLEACYGKKAGPPFPADPKAQQIIKQKFGNITNYSTIPETLEERYGIILM